MELDVEVELMSNLVNFSFFAVDAWAKTKNFKSLLAKRSSSLLGWSYYSVKEPSKTCLQLVVLWSDESAQAMKCKYKQTKTNASVNSNHHHVAKICCTNKTLVRQREFASKMLHSRGGMTLVNSWKQASKSHWFDLVLLSLKKLNTVQEY